MEGGGSPEDNGETGGVRRVRGQRRPKPQAPSPGAQRLLDILQPFFATQTELESGLKAWFEGRGLRWRPVDEYLSGLGWDLPRKHADALPDLAESITGEAYKVWEFINAKGVRNFAVDFTAKNPEADTLLKRIRGTYTAIRPGGDSLDDSEYRFDADNDDRNLLQITYKAPGLPSVFQYTTLNKDGDALGAWEGYVVATPPLVYLLGFCRKGEDVAYMVLREHPDPKHAPHTLVGVQSLLLSYPENGPTHAVTRHLAATRCSGASTAQPDLGVAHRWINDGQKDWPGMRVQLEFRSRKG